MEEKYTITEYTVSLNGKPIVYTNVTEFLVQIGRNRKASYQTRYTFRGNLHQAVFYYNCINIGNGYKKRLLMPSSKKPIIARQFS
jgi:hypothetical protein